MDKGMLSVSYSFFHDQIWGKHAEDKLIMHSGETSPTILPYSLMTNFDTLLVQI